MNLEYYLERLHELAEREKKRKEKENESGITRRGYHGHIDFH
jgi:hypothetical protein